MINRADALECFEKELFGGPGAVHFTKIVNENGLAGKGRLFNIGTLKPGCAVGNHKHNGEIEIYYILYGQGIYTQTGVEAPVTAGDVTVCNHGQRHGLLNTGSTDLKMVALILFTK